MEIVSLWFSFLFILSEILIRFLSAFIAMTTASPMERRDISILGGIIDSIDSLGSHRRAGRTLETRIVSVERPRSEHGELVCVPCNSISLRYVGNHPDPKFSGEKLYQCEHCSSYWFDPRILE